MNITTRSKRVFVIEADERELVAIQRGLEALIADIYYPRSTHPYGPPDTSISATVLAAVRAAREARS